MIKREENVTAYITCKEKDSLTERKVPFYGLYRKKAAKNEFQQLHRKKEIPMKIGTCIMQLCLNRISNEALCSMVVLCVTFLLLYFAWKYLDLYHKEQMRLKETENQSINLSMII